MMPLSLLAGRTVLTIKKGPDNKNVLTFFFNFVGNLNILCRYIVKGTIKKFTGRGWGPKFSMGLQSFFSGWERGGVQLLISKETYVFCYFSGGGGGGPNPSSRNVDLDVWHNFIDLV